MTMRLHRRHGGSMFSSYIRCLGIISVLLGVVIGQNGDVIGVDVCGCAPGTYKLTFDFSLTCPPVNITRNGGVATTFCQTSPLVAGDGDTITDLVPVMVESVSVLELGQDFTVVAQSNFTQIFMDGDSLTYTSIVVDQAEPVDVNNIPKVLQVNIFGFNAQNQPIVNWYAIGFSNNCVSYPVLEPGNNAGWTSFTSLSAPPRNVCPAVPTAPPTAPPTIAPTGVPSASPTVSPTMAGVPTARPTARPTGTPTTRPTATPTVTPNPTLSPVSPAPTGFSMSMEEFDMGMFEDLIDGVDGFVPPSFKSPKMVPKMKEGKRAKSVKASTKSGKKSSKKSSKKGSTKNSKSQSSVKSSKSAKSAKASHSSVKSSKSAKSAKSAAKGKKRRLRLTHRVD